MFVRHETGQDTGHEARVHQELHRRSNRIRQGRDQKFQWCLLPALGSVVRFDKHIQMVVKSRIARRNVQN